jgi:hypothetical protein
VATEHPGFVSGRRIPERDPDHEPIDLGLRERIRALVLDRVLGCQHQERPRQLVGVDVDGHPALLHALEQAGLGLGRGAVDLVDQHDIGEHGPGTELKALLALVVDAGPDNVCGEQVRGALDPSELAVDRAGHRARQRRLADARVVLDQHVPLGQQRHDQVVERRAADLNGARDVVGQTPRDRG